MSKPILWGVKLKEFLAWLGFFWTYIGFYLLVLIFSLNAPPGDIAAWRVRIINELWIMDGMRCLFTIGIWWLFFRKLKHVPFNKKLWLHMPVLFVYLVVVYHLGAIALSRIGQPMKAARSSALFDYYVPMTVYLVQFGIFHVYEFWLNSKKQTQREKILMELAYQSEISALKAQIQPHFLFNTLNSISASVSPKQEKTRVLIAELADTFRYALRSTQADLVPLSCELTFISTYLDLEKERFKERLEVVISVHDEVRYALIPPMLLQPLVENALKYGIAPLVEGGSIEIICQKKDNYLHIAVKDSGQGYNGDLDSLRKAKGIGLRNIATRIEKLYEESLHIYKNDPKGLVVAFRIPLKVSK